MVGKNNGEKGMERSVLEHPIIKVKEERKTRLFVIFDVKQSRLCA